MTFNDLQLWVTNDWQKNSRHLPDVELQLLYIIEEMGEVAEAIRKQKGKKNRKTTETNLGSEMADLFISLVTLANYFKIDLDQEIEKFKERIAKRHDAGH